MKQSSVKIMVMVSIMVLGGSFITRNASAASVYGTVNFLGTIGESGSLTDGYQARLRIRLPSSTCSETGNAKTERWITIKSGRMDEKFAHNAVNYRNIFNLLTVAYLSGKAVQIDGLPNCNSGNTINAWSSQIGLY